MHELDMAQAKREAAGLDVPPPWPALASYDKRPLDAGQTVWVGGGGNSGDQMLQITDGKIEKVPPVQPGETISVTIGGHPSDVIAATHAEITATARATSGYGDDEPITVPGQLDEVEEDPVVVLEPNQAQIAYSRILVEGMKKIAADYVGVELTQEVADAMSMRIGLEFNMWALDGEPLGYGFLSNDEYGTEFKVVDGRMKVSFTPATKAFFVGKVDANGKPWS